MTHELRTPLASIRMQAEALQDSLTLKAQEAQWMERLLEDTQRLQSQVERSLQLSRLKGGGVLYLRSLRLKVYLESFVRDWNGAMSLALKAPDQDCLVRADPEALRIVLSNAIENVKMHGKVDNAQLELQMSPKGVKLKVKDEGLGYVGKGSELGELFKKGENSPGTGVGLYLVKELSRQMGAKAEFFPQSKGFEVQISFPELRLA